MKRLTTDDITFALLELNFIDQMKALGFTLFAEGEYGKEEYHFINKPQGLIIYTERKTLSYNIFSLTRNVKLLQKESFALDAKDGKK